MKIIADEIAKIRAELDELEAHLPGWNEHAHGIDGSKKYRGVAHRIFLSTQRLESLVKENTFSR
jgi:hypothetical protein